MTVEYAVKQVRSLMPDICGLKHKNGLIKKVELQDFIGQWVASTGLMDPPGEYGGELTEANKARLFMGILVPEFSRSSEDSCLTYNIEKIENCTLYIFHNNEERDKTIECLKNSRKEIMEKNGYVSL